MKHFHLVVGVVGVVKNGKDIANCEDHRGQPGGPQGEVWENIVIKSNELVFFMKRKTYFGPK